MKVKKINGLFKAVEGLTDIFKEGQRQKKWSAKRSVSGVLVAAAVSDMAATGLTELNVLLSFIAVLPLCFTVFSKV